MIWINSVQFDAAHTLHLLVALSSLYSVVNSCC